MRHIDYAVIECGMIHWNEQACIIDHISLVRGVQQQLTSDGFCVIILLVAALPYYETRHFENIYLFISLPPLCGERLI